MAAGGIRNVTHQAHMKAITNYLEALGWWVCKLAGGMYQRPGLPDLIACKAGRMIAVEVKTGRGKLSQQQKSELERLAAAGCFAVVVSCVDNLEEMLLTAGLIDRRYLAPRFGLPSVVPYDT